MKKYNKFLFLAAAASSVVMATSCDEDKLEIEQKNATPIEEFYKTDADAESALVTVYADTYNNFAFESEYTGWNYSPYLALINFQGDDIFLAGSGTGDCGPEREYHDFRYTTANNVVLAGYAAFYRSIHKCNLLINNFELLEGEKSKTMKRCIAEARVMRAFDHLLLGIYWGTPPIVETVLTGDDRPANAESQTAVMDWVAKEIDLALPDLDERKSTEDYEGAVKITKGFAYAVKGKALLWKGDYAGAKAALGEVIKSGKYALVPSEDMTKIGHNNGKGSSEIVFEFNLVSDGTTSLGNRQMGNFPYTFNWRYEFLQPLNAGACNLGADGWGWTNPSKEFCDALIKNDGMNSARRKAWIISYDEMLYNLAWSSDGDSFTPGKTDAKESDLDRGLKKEYYGNVGYFCWKTVMHEPGDNLNQSWCGTWNANYTIMRYAEVLLMYAEACAQVGDPDGTGLQYLNDIQRRAQSNHISETLTLAEVQNEKWFEMFQDGCRIADLIRWKKYETLNTADHEVWNLYDPVLDYDPVKDKDKPAPKHETIVKKDEQFDFYKKAGAGFKEGKNELLPFPQRAVDLNTSLKQNPGW